MEKKTLAVKVPGTSLEEFLFRMKCCHLGLREVAGTMVQSHQDLYVLIKQHQVSCTSVCIELLLAYLYIYNIII